MDSRGIHFLRQLSSETIRLMVDNMRGYGNQDATANVVDYLRASGFTGVIELVYASLTREKVQNIFGLPENMSDDHFSSEKNMRFVTLRIHVQELKKNTLKKVTLGLTGAYDQAPCQLAEKDGVNTTDLSESTCDNEADFLQVEAFVHLPTYPDDAGTSVYLLGKMFKNPGKPIYPFPVEDSRKKSVLGAPIKQDQAQKLFSKNPALVALTSAKNKLSLYSVYGYTIQKTHLCTDCFPGNTLQIVSGVKKYQSEHDNKPAVVAFFYDYSEELAELYNTIFNDNSDNPSSEGEQLAKKEFQRLNLRDSIVMGKLSDDDITDKIKNLPKGKILLLSIYALQRDYFRALFMQGVPFCEGERTRSYLIGQGIPYFQIPLRQIYPELMSTELAADFNNFYASAFKGWDSWRLDQNITSKLAQHIAAIDDPHSAFNHYAARLKKYAQENDAIKQALNCVVDLLDATYPSNKTVSTPKLLTTGKLHKVFKKKTPTENHEYSGTHVALTEYEQYETTHIKSLQNGALHGALRGIVKSVESKMKTEKSSARKTFLVTNGLYYGSVLASNFWSHFSQTDTQQDASQRLATASYQTASDAAKLIFLNMTPRVIESAAKKAFEKGWKRTSSVVKFFGQACETAVFAFNAKHLNTAMDAIAVGFVTEKIVSNLGISAVKRWMKPKS